MFSTGILFFTLASLLGFGDTCELTIAADWADNRPPDALLDPDTPFLEVAPLAVGPLNVNADDIDNRLQSGDLDVAYQDGDLPRFRVNAFKQRGHTTGLSTTTFTTPGTLLAAAAS